MKIISPANQTVMTVLGKARVGAAYRMLHYTAETPVEDGILICNLLTKELLLLTQEEYDDRLESAYLRENWFVVPEEMNDQEYADLVRWAARVQKKKSDYINSYTIFTTTDCNARCFYCFELGWKRIHMTEETALKVVQYIKNHCGGKKVKISWFGGEPLYNMGVIDIICDGLRKEGVEFISNIATNGYLFNKETVEKAVRSWNLALAQVAMDGTQEVYNKIKAYIYKEGNPYEVVMENVGHLIRSGVEVFVRLNMDLENQPDLIKLVDELGERYAEEKKLYIYASHLYKGGVPSADIHTKEEWEQRENAMMELYARIERYGMVKKRGLHKNVRLNSCMADSEHAITIAPTGDLGRCELCNEKEFIGHIDRAGFDEEKLATWKELIDQVPECKTCFFYPECMILKKCSSASICFEQQRSGRLRQTKHRMQYEYDCWKQK